MLEVYAQKTWQGWFFYSSGPTEHWISRSSTSNSEVTYRRVILIILPSSVNWFLSQITTAARLKKVRVWCLTAWFHSMIFRLRFLWQSPNKSHQPMRANGGSLLRVSKRWLSWRPIHPAFADMVNNVHQWRTTVYPGLGPIVTWLLREIQTIFWTRWLRILNAAWAGV